MNMNQRSSVCYFGLSSWLPALALGLLVAGCGAPAGGTGSGADSPPDAANDAQIDTSTGIGNDVVAMDAASADLSGGCTADSDCNDGNPCMAHTCTAGKCAFKPMSTGTCDDGNPCTTGDTCQAGKCLGGAGLDCDDNDLCTKDTCDPKTGCLHAFANGVPCDDGQKCTTQDVCNGGKCLGVAPNCADNNPCTDDTCADATGCVHLPNAATCDDGNTCTGIDTCAASVCVHGGPLNCDDLNPCTKDSCDVAAGCVHAASDGKCDDGNACTGGDHCAGGLCTGATVSCDDNNICTTDSCDPEQGCAHAGADVACSDNNPCTANDNCSGGQCAPGTAVTCDDGIACTADSCDPALGCVHMATAATCTDGNACTTGDACVGGTCQPSGNLACNDGNACTNDSCAFDTGCVYGNADDALCNDGNACTAGDICTSGECLGTPSVVCTNSDQCHDAGTCNPASGACEGTGASSAVEQAQLVGDGSLGFDFTNGIGQSFTVGKSGAFAGVEVSLGPCNNALTSGMFHLGIYDAANKLLGTVDKAQAAFASVGCGGNGLIANTVGVGYFDLSSAGISVTAGQVLSWRLTATVGPNAPVCNKNGAPMGTCSNGGPPMCMNDSDCGGFYYIRGTNCSGIGCSGNPGDYVGGTELMGQADGTFTANGGFDLAFKSFITDTLAKTDGTTCDDGLLCTTSDQCTAGVCGGAPVVCTAAGECQAVGTCDTGTGTCTNPAASDGTSCTGNHLAGGKCQAGLCGGQCATGWGDCNGTFSDGCELDVSSDTFNCGSCGSSCFSPGAVCSDSKCGCGPQTQDCGFQCMELCSSSVDYFRGRFQYSIGPQGNAPGNCGYAKGWMGCYGTLDTQTSCGVVNAGCF